MPLPPGPVTHKPLRVAKWMLRPTDFLVDAGRRYGDIFTVNFPGIGHVVMTSSPEAIKEVFALGPDEGHAGKANFVLKPFLGEHSLLLLDGAEHLRQRKMMLPAFHGERMNAYGHAMIEAADAAIDAMPIGREIRLHPVMQNITLQVILRTVFGMDEGPKFQSLAEALARGLDAVAWPPLLFPFLQKDLGPWSPWGKFVRESERARRILLAEIARLRATGTGKRTDVLAMFVDAKDETGAPMRDEEILHELVTLLVAGHETTATALAWAFRWLLATPSVLRRLRTEIEGAMQGSALAPDKLAKLELLDGVVKETLRLQPVIPVVARILQEPKRILGWDLPKGTPIAPCILLTHRRESLYPNPDSFDPDRWKTFKPAPSEWLPFGGGLRKCIGAAFAMYEMKMVLAAMVTRTEMRLARSRIRTVRRAISLTPSEGLPIVVTGRWKRTGRQTVTPAVCA